MTDSRLGRSLLARIRASLAEPEPATEPAPEPPRREHLYGSTYRVRMSFEELMATRGYIGQQALRRRLVSPNDTERQRDVASQRAGHVPGEVLWPSE